MNRVVLSDSGNNNGTWLQIMPPIPFLRLAQDKGGFFPDYVCAFSVSNFPLEEIQKRQFETVVREAVSKLKRE
jgi:hypothetical protein